MRVISRWLAFNTAEKHFAHQSLSHTVADMHPLRLKDNQALWRLPDAPSPSFHAFSRHAKTLRVWSWHTRATFLQNLHRWVQEMTGYGLKWVFRSSPSPFHNGICCLKMMQRALHCRYIKPLCIFFCIRMRHVGNNNNSNRLDSLKFKGTHLVFGHAFYFP